MEIGTLIQVVEMIDNHLTTQKDLLCEQIDNKMPVEIVNRTAGGMIALLRLKEHIQAGIEADIAGMESAYGYE